MPGRITPEVPTNQVFMARKAQRRQATYLADVGAPAPDAILSPDSYGCLADSAATPRHLPTFRTPAPICCSMTSGLSTGPIGPGLVALPQEMQLALTVPKAPLRQVMHLPRVKHPLAGSTTTTISGCSVGLPAARTDSTTYGSSTPPPNH